MRKYWTAAHKLGSITLGDIYSPEVRLLSNHNLPHTKPSDHEQVGTGLSAGPIVLDEVGFLRLPDVKGVTGLSKSSLYALIRANSFPAPVRLGPRTVAWVRSEVRQWAAERVRAPRSTASNAATKRLPQRAPGDTWAPSRKSA